MKLEINHKQPILLLTCFLYDSVVFVLLCQVSIVRLSLSSSYSFSSFPSNAPAFGVAHNLCHPVLVLFGCLPTLPGSPLMTSSCSLYIRRFLIVLIRPCSCIYLPIGLLTTSFVKGLSVYVGVCGKFFLCLSTRSYCHNELASSHAMRTSVNNQTKPNQ